MSRKEEVMPRKKGRIKEKVVAVARGARKRFDEGGAMTSGTAVAVLAGGVGGAVGTALLSRKINPYLATGAVSTVGTVAAFATRGKVQAAAVGAAVGSIAAGITHALSAPKPKKEDKPAESTTAAGAIDKGRSNAALPPADVQAAFDAARAEMARHVAVNGVDEYPYADAAA
jgi:hypothetical protein